MKRNAFLLVFVVFCSYIGLLRVQSPEVCLDRSACAVGKYVRGFQRNLYEAFFGIPFAKPPINELRFSNPEEIQLWKGKFFAENPKLDCMQRDYIRGHINGSEDCLYLNIYRPLNSGDMKLAVLFYIHGGGFARGSASPQSLGAEYFMDTGDVILVVPAYRLGPFGFLSTNDEEMPGNFGLKDQNIALKWVQKHISAFGGDPDRVTIFGHSAGAAAAHYHLLSPASKDLFRNAILISGVANSPFASPTANPRPKVIKLAEAVGIKESANLSSKVLMRALRRINPTTLIKAVEKLKSWNIYPLAIFHPNIEQGSWNGSFLTAHPSSLSIEKPWIIAHVPSKGEGVPMARHLATNQSLRAIFNRQFDTLLRTILELPDTIDGAALNQTIEKYLNGEHELKDETLDGFFEFLGDGSFVYPIYKTIQSHLSSAVTQNLKGMIKFDYSGPYSYSELFTGGNKNFSTVHSDDSLFLFSVSRAFPRGYSTTSPEAVLVKRYVDIYVEFAKTGKVEKLENIATCTKDSYERGSCEYLSIVKSPELFQTDSTWDIDRMKLWDDVYKGRTSL